VVARKLIHLAAFFEEAYPAAALLNIVVLSPKSGDSSDTGPS